jgi:glycosyl transferase family 25
MRSWADSATPILVINLDRHPNRLARIMGEFKRLGLGFERLAAIDCDRLDDAAVREVYDPRANRSHYFAPLNRAEVACWLSHRKAWKAVADSAADFGVVFEDDATLSDTLLTVLARLNERPIDWDILKLHSYETNVAARIGALAPGVGLVRHVTVSLRTVAYCVSRVGAHKLLASTLPIKRPLDVELQHWWDHAIEVLAIEPSVVEPARDIASSIRDARLGLGRRLVREIRRPLFRFRLSLRSIRELWRAGLV